MRYVIRLMSVGLLALVVGCGSQSAAGPASGTSTTSATTTTTSAPPKLTEAEVEQKISQAMVVGTAFDGRGGKLQKGPDQHVKTQLLTVTCEGELPSNRLISKESGSIWYVAGSVVKTGVVHYDGLKANEIFDSLRKLISCGTYVETWTAEMATVTVTGEITLPKAAEADGQFSWCETTSKEFARCYAVLTRGAFAATVQIGTGSKDKAEAVLTDVVPVAAKALANVG